jgi:uncharacterized protein YndB with AHSA1/START domain
MGHNWNVDDEFELDATPEEVWQAIASGPGIDSWFMGVSDVEPGVGGTVTTDFGGFAQRSEITAWEPTRHLAYTSEPSPDGRFIAFEYLLEAKDGGTTVMRQVATGFLPGDDWEAEFEAMVTGGLMYTRTLRSYVDHFTGRFGVPVSAMVQHPDFDRAWARMQADLGLPAETAEGDRVTLTPTGFAPIAGVIDYLADGYLGVRTDDALYRFYRGFFGPGLGHHVFTDGADRARLEAEWQAWLGGAVA